MTIQQIKDFLFEKGLPRDYPLRGRKEQVIASGIRFFKSVVDWQIIVGRGVDEKNRAALREVEEKLTK